MQVNVDGWVASALGCVFVASLGSWMASIYKAADRAAAAAESAAAALVAVQEKLGTLVERTTAQGRMLDAQGADIRSIREVAEESARDGQGVAAIVARHAEILESLRCQGNGEVGHG